MTSPASVYTRAQCYDYLGKARFQLRREGRRSVARRVEWESMSKGLKEPSGGFLEEWRGDGEDNWVEKTQVWEGWQVGGSCILVSVSEEQGVELWEKLRQLLRLHLHCGLSSNSQGITSCWQKGTKVAMATWQTSNNINIHKHLKAAIF